MIFKKLTLKNFMSYSNAEIDFSGIHVSCLIGVNGAGKSSLLDAITWTLWEEGRGRTDELIKLGNNEMSCELEFFMEDELYRVYRSRVKAFKSSQGKSNLEFQIFNSKDQNWVSLSMSATRQTQELITKTLKMDHQTFVNSVYLRQGKADEFTLKKPNERKQILADILGLEVYDRLCDSTRQKTRLIEQNVTLEQGLIEALKEKILKEDELKKSLENLTVQANKEDNELLELKTQLNIKEKELNEKREQEKQIYTIEKSKTSQESLIQALEEQLQNLKLKQEKHKELVNNKNQIENEYKKYIEMKDKLELHEREKDIHNQLVQEKNLLELELKGAINQSLKDSLSKVETEGLALKHKKELLLSDLKKLTEKKQDIADKIETLLLRNHSEPCPLCKGEIKDKQKVIESYKSELKSCEKEEEVLSTALKLREEELLEKRGRFNKILEISKGEFHGAKGHVLTLEKEIDHPIKKIIEKLDSAIASLGRLSYDQKFYDDLKKSLKEKENIILKQKLLLEAVSEISILASEITNLTLKINSSHEDLSTLKKLITEHKNQIANIGFLQEEVNKIKQKESEKNTQLNEIKKQKILTEQSLSGIDTAKTEVKEKENKIDKLLNDKSQYEILEKAFSKNGIQAAIIETLVPEIENEANRILSRLTENQMHIALKTQREKKSASGMIETLDVVIADNLGTRNYELYSGGEAFKIDFAIRLALSRLLANRACAKLQTLIIDEGFGSQDTSGRERLVEVIKSIEKEFELILVVTHIDELKESFPTQIQVSKDDEGSKVRLVA